MGRGRGRRGRGGSGGANPGRNQKSSTSAKTGSFQRLQERDDCSSMAVSGDGDRPTTRRSSLRSAVAEAINGGNDGTTREIKKTRTEAEASAMNSGSVEQSVSSAIASASPSRSETGGAQEPTPKKRARKSAAVDGDQNGTDSKAGPSTVSRSAPSNGNHEEAGSSKRLTRAEEIQLEADLIPSVKTSTWNPFTVFPEKIWGIIFDNITDFKDKENFINATPEWRQMCLPKMPTALLQQVLSIMEQQKDPDDEYESLLKEEDYFPFRLVCKSWDQSVQNFIQWHPVHFDMALKSGHSGRDFMTLNNYDNQGWQKWSFCFSGDYEQERLDEMAKTHPHPFNRNPFLSRQIEFSDEEISESENFHPCCRGGADVGPAPPHDINAIAQDFRSKIVTILERYGRHVWDCTINFRVNLTPATWYINIQHWISLMQNLKVLKLEYAISEYKPITENQRTELGNQIAISPLSELKGLIYLKTEDVPGPVFNELISKATNLQKLYVFFRGVNTGTRLIHYQFDRMTSQNLTECYLTLLCAEDFTHLESMGGSWPLKKLYLELQYENKDMKTNTYPTWAGWDHTFKVIGEKFGATLLDLKLELPKATKPADMKRVLDESPNYRLNLPNVKSLGVVVPNLTSYDFLLPLRSLKQLCIVVDYLESYGKIKKKTLKANDILKFTDNFHQLFKTNIWEELPKLKRVKLYILKKPSRDEYGRWNDPLYTTHDYDKEKMNLVEEEVEVDSDS